jgi:hypothetical protein
LYLFLFLLILLGDIYQQMGNFCSSYLSSREKEELRESRRLQQQQYIAIPAVSYTAATTEKPNTTEQQESQSNDNRFKQLKPLPKYTDSNQEPQTSQQELQRATNNDNITPEMNIWPPPAAEATTPTTQIHMNIWPPPLVAEVEESTTANTKTDTSDTTTTATNSNNTLPMEKPHLIDDIEEIRTTAPSSSDTKNDSKAKTKPRISHNPDTKDEEEDVVVIENNIWPPLSSSN